MVRFESADEQAERALQEPADTLAPVTYLPGAEPGMKRRSPLDGRTRSSRTRSSSDDGASIVSLPTVRPADGFDLGRDTDTDHDADRDIDNQFDADPEVEAAAERERAEETLLKRLRGRSLSTAEAQDILRATELDEETVEEIVERFTELHYIDEAKLADQIVHSHHERKGLGRTGVEAEMRRRKVLPEVILEKLEEMPDDEQERATELALKRVQQLDRFDEQTIDRRLTGFLMRKGYSSAAVRVAVKAALASRKRSASSVRFR